MARKFLVNVDLAGNQLLNTVVQVLASAPSSPKEGQIYFDSTKKELGSYNGSAWTYSGTIAEATTSSLGIIELAGDLAGTASSPQIKNLHLTGDTSIGHKLTEVSEPTASADAATKSYVDGKINGIQWKNPVVVATTANLAAEAAGSGAAHTLKAEVNGILEIDGVKVETVGERVLVKNQTEAKNNGIYTLTTKGEAGAKYILTRAADAATEVQLLDATVAVEKGTANADKYYNMPSGPPLTVETTSVEWVEIQNGTQVVGDETYTTRTANKIEIKPVTAAPTELTGENEISAVSKGTSRKCIVEISGNASAKKFKLAHGLGTYYVRLQGYENESNHPSTPVEVDWKPISTSEVEVEFATAPAAKAIYHFAIWG